MQSLISSKKNSFLQRITLHRFSKGYSIASFCTCNNLRVHQQKRGVKIDLSDKSDQKEKEPLPNVPYHPWLKPVKIIVTVLIILLVIHITKSYWLLNASFHTLMVSFVYLKKFFNYISLLFVNLLSSESEITNKLKQNKPL